MLHVRNSAFGPLSQPVPRFDPFPEQRRRRRFTPDEKARLVAESFTSGESVCSFARRHGLMPSQLFAWRKTARGAEGATDPSPAEDGSMHPAQIEISIGAAVVRVPPGVDPATLKLVLQALQEAA